MHLIHHILPISMIYHVAVDQKSNSTGIDYELNFKELTPSI